MLTFRYLLLLGVVGLSCADSPTSPTAIGGKTGKPSSWFNFWEVPVAGNSRSSGGLFTTPHPAGGAAVAGGARQQVGAAGQKPANNNNGGFFNWFSSGGVVSGSSGSPPAVGTAVPVAGAPGQPIQRPGHQGAQQPGNGGYQHDTHYTHGGSSGEVNRRVDMANPNSGGGTGGAHGNPGLAVNAGDIGRGAAGGNPSAKGIGNLPLNHNAHGLEAGNTGSQVGPSSAASAILGVAVALVVLVGAFAGVAVYLKRQRRNNHIMMASV